MWLNLNNIEDLPLQESRKEYITKKYGDMWNLRRFDYHTCSLKNDIPWFILKCVLKRYLNEPADKAFSYFSNLVRVDQQKEFHNYFFGGRYIRYTSEYIIDDEGIIRYHGKVCKRRKTIFYSFDYVEQYRYETKFGHYISDDNKSKYGSYSYHKIVVSGYTKEFKSRNEKEFVKLMAEKRQKQRILKTELKKVKLEVGLSKNILILKDMKNKEKFELLKERYINVFFKINGRDVYKLFYDHGNCIMQLDENSPKGRYTIHAFENVVKNIENRLVKPNIKNDLTLPINILSRLIEIETCGDMKDIKALISDIRNDNKL